MPATLGIDDIDDSRTRLHRFRTDFLPGVSKDDEGGRSRLRHVCLSR